MAATLSISRELLQAILCLPMTVHITAAAMDSYTVKLTLDGPGLPEGATEVKALYGVDPDPLVKQAVFKGFEKVA